MSCNIAIGHSPVEREPFWPAQALQAPERQALAIGMLSGTCSVSQTARENGVSRKFLYAQADKARTALEESHGTYTHVYQHP